MDAVAAFLRQGGEISFHRRGENATAGDCVHKDIGPGHFDSNGTGEREDGPLGRTVRRIEGAVAADSGDRGDVDDLAGLLRLHDPQRLAGTVEYPVNVDAP